MPQEPKKDKVKFKSKNVRDKKGRSIRNMQIKFDYEDVIFPKKDKNNG